jgi:hypothetical protein
VFVRFGSLSGCMTMGRVVSRRAGAGRTSSVGWDDEPVSPLTHLKSGVPRRIEEGRETR